jgi:pimeloyl-ACP methyl ester carboxylesterase
MELKQTTKMMRKGINQLFLKVLAVLIILPAIAFAADPPGIPDGWSDGYVYANGIRIHYYHAVPAPEKPVIVMVHGVTDIGLSWTTLTWKLQESYDIYMLDARGHGLSDPFTSSDDGETLLKDIVGFVKAMNIKKPILMGHSMGAASVMRVGAAYPDLARAIIMLDPFIASSNPNGSRIPSSTPQNEGKESAQSNQAPQRRNASSQSINPEAMVANNNQSFNDLVAKAHRDNPMWGTVDCQYWALSKRQYHGPYTAEQSQAMRGTMNSGEALSKITVPSLILKADASPESRKANEEAVNNLPKVKLVHVDGAAHNLHHDKLERTVKEINGFLLGL